MGKRRTGLHPLAYMGVEPSTPPNLITQNFPPTANDSEFNLGTMWIDLATDDVYMLTNLDGGDATWTTIVTTSGDDGELLIGATGGLPAWANLESSGGSVTITNTANGINLEAAGIAALTQLDGDSGSATPAAGIITIAGGTNVTTVGGVNTLTVNLDGSPSVSGSLTAGTSVASGTTIVAGSSLESTTTMTCGTGLTVSAGGIDSTGTTTLQDLGDGVVFSSAAGVLSDSAGNDGQLIIGATGTTPAWASVTSSGNTIEITEGANTLNLETLTGVFSPYLFPERDASVSSSHNITGLAISGSLFVFCTSDESSDGTIYSSTDGITWTLRHTGDEYVDVAYGADGNWVAVSSETPNKGEYSTNGTSWSALTDVSLESYSVNYGSDGYWVITQGSRIKWAMDPTAGSWGSASLSTVIHHDSVYTGSLWVIVSAGGKIFTATNPAGAWTPRTSTFPNTEDIRGVAYSSTLTLLCAVGEMGKIITSPDGITWTQRPNVFGTTDRINRVAWDSTEELFVAVSEAGTIGLSRNGLEWFNDYKGSANLNAVAFGNASVLIGADSAIVKTSF